MTSQLAYELIRQALRWVGFYLAAVGLPDEYAATFQDPAFVQAIGGGLIAIAESGWLAAKWRQFRAWRSRK
jgi:hypothetical protein